MFESNKSFSPESKKKAALFEGAAFSTSSTKLITHHTKLLK